MALCLFEDFRHLGPSWDLISLHDGHARADCIDLDPPERRGDCAVFENVARSELQLGLH